jgi:hypothetical protein
MAISFLVPGREGVVFKSKLYGYEQCSIFSFAGKLEIFRRISLRLGISVNILLKEQP